MVYKKTMKKSKTSKKKPYSKSRKYLPWSTWAVARPSAPAVGLGTSATTVLRTSFFYNATATGGTGVWNGYLAPGSCFDPTGDLSTLQPQLFDQFAAVYNRYKVNSCKIRIKITGAVGNSGASSWVAAAYPAVDSTALATYQAAASQQYAKTTSGGYQLLFGAATYGIGTEGKYLSFDLNHNAVVGAKSDTWDIGALVSASPTALQFMVLPMLLQGNLTGAHTWVLEIDMWQNVTFSQKKNPVDA